MAVEFRGCRNLVYAEVTSDDNEDSPGGYVTGTVKKLAPVAEISKTVETSSEAKFYDNVSSIMIDSEGMDTVTFTIAIPSDEVLADITGRYYDQAKKAIIETPKESKSFAVGYILGEVGEGEEEKYVWRYKGTFGIPDETAATKDNSTTTNNMSLTFNGVFTTHTFTNGGGTGVAAPAKAMALRPSETITEAKFFGTVFTPDSSTT